MAGFLTQTSAIGLDVDHGVARLVQLAVTPSRPQPAAVTAAHFENYSDRAALHTILRRAIGSRRFRGRDVVACLPRGLVHVRSVRVPAAPGDTVDSAVLDAVAPLLPFPIDTARVQALSSAAVRDADKSSCEAVVLAVRHADIDAFLLPLHDAGLRVVALDTSVTAVYRGLSRCTPPEDVDAPRLVVELGDTQTHVTIAADADIRFFKAIDLGIAHLSKAIARKLSISLIDADALRRRLIQQPADDTADPVRRAVFDATRGVAEQLSHELVLCQRYYSVMFRGQPLQRLELTGHGATDISLHRIFAATLGLACTAITWPLETAGATVDLFDGSWGAAVGATMKFMPNLSTGASNADPVGLEVARA